MIERDQLALGLAIFTVAYNVIEGAVSVLFAALDGSVALLGFGVDSFVESLSGLVMIWRFWRPAASELREQRAARLVGATFIVLSAYVAFESTTELFSGDKGHRSLAAIIVAAVSLVVMPILFALKLRTAYALGSRSLLADSKQTLACSLLSVALLAGAGLNYWAAIWYADPIAGLVIAVYLMWEGYEALTAKELCQC